MIDAATAAQRWAERMQSAGERVRQGVMHTSKDPIQAAISKASTWQAQVSSSRALDRYKSGLSRSSKSAWQHGMVDKGIPNMANGARIAQPKMQAFLSSFLPFLDGVTQRTNSMPSGGLENGIARMNAQARAVAQYKRT